MQAIKISLQVFSVSDHGLLLDTVNKNVVFSARGSKLSCLVQEEMNSVQEEVN